MCHNGTFHHTTTLFQNPKKSLSAEAKLGIAARSRQAILRRISRGLYISPTKNPAVAAKVRAALLQRIQEGKWKRPGPGGRKGSASETDRLLNNPNQRWM
jgi:hypothetical protein